MNTFSRIATAAVASVATAFAVVPAASAAEYWNDYTVVGLPEWVTGPTQFEVVPDGPEAVCGMRFGDQSVTAAPWVLTYDPARVNSNYVGIILCNGDSDYASIDAEVPFDFFGTYAQPGRDVISVVTNRTDVPSTVTMLDESGQPIWSTPLAPGDAVDIPAPKALKETKAYTLTATTDDGALSMSHRIVAPVGWSLMMDEAAFPCGVITWAYDSKGQPAKAKKILPDIEESLARLTTETGLTFVRVTDGQPADITFSWEKMGKDGPGGLGGFQASSDSRSTGRVRLNSQSYWVMDKFAGFDGFKPYKQGNRTYTGGPADRGWLIIHETMHALGFGHVDDKKSVMNPYNNGQAGFTKNDLKGLQTLYPCLV